MPRALLTAVLLCALAVAGHAQSDAAAVALQAVLNRMDSAAKGFQSAEAQFVWDQFQRVVSETDTQKGSIYFRRTSKEVQMAADITEPDKKYVLYSGAVVRVYQPRIDQVTEYKTGANRAEVESFLVLGFGGGGHSLERTFEVRYAGAEPLAGVPTDKLELVPRSEKGRNTFSRILLWIDVRGVSVQQQFFEPSGDYRLARYLNIKLNQKLPDGAFKLKTTSRTRVVDPQG